MISGKRFTGYVSDSGNSSSSGARSPAFTSTLSRPRSRSHTESAAKEPASAEHAPSAAARQDSRGVCAAAIACASATTARNCRSSAITPA
ncbi:hypothetical protein [Streptomyces sp. NPDC059130]|uniref:hypothetical protein n=1 Tax=Streptomyces sp. NPDC059130 TaxID=3346735 RepID=UPI00368BC455